MNEIDRVHHIGKHLFDSDSMQKVRIMANSLLYSSPKKFYERQGETRCQEFQCIVRSTKRRYAFLAKTKGLDIDNPSFAYYFCDINCSLLIKSNDNMYKYFNSENELNNLLVL